MCKPEICAICHHKSWTGCGQHVSKVMDTSSKSNWCTCEPIDAEEQASSYPPRAGTGFARKTSVS